MSVKNKNIVFRVSYEVWKKARHIAVEIDAPVGELIGHILDEVIDNDEKLKKIIKRAKHVRGTS